MKSKDFVKLIELKDSYKKYNLYLGVKGIIVETNKIYSKVLFLNDYNQGDYAFLEVFNNDLEIISDTTSNTLISIIDDGFKTFIPKEKGFKSITFKAYDHVELLVESEKYAKYGVHKGDIGTIMEDVAVQDYILVDFGRLDEDNNYCGDCISVNLKDVKILGK